MRAWLMVTLLLALAAASFAQGADEGAKGEEAGKDPAAAEPKPEEPPAWQMPENISRKFGDELGDYLNPGKKDRADVLKKLEKILEKDIDGHSLLEDVATITTIANQERVFGKLKRGRVEEEEVTPKVHGFPGGIGTVKYWLWLPKGYTERELWPVLFCLPDNKEHPDGEAYLKERIEKCPLVAEKFIVVVPQPMKKGDKWTSDESLARAMIALRHVCGTYDADAKYAGPASDLTRLFIEGGDEAAIIAGRFPEMFAGAILEGTDGQMPGEPNLRAVGRLSGLPAFLAYDPKSKRQREFAEAVKADNALSQLSPGLPGDCAAFAKWMEELPARNTQPREISYAVHESSFQRHYWITVLDFEAGSKEVPTFHATADHANNVVRIEVSGISRFELFLNDALVDLSQPISIVVIEDDKEMPFFKTKDGRDTAPRDLGTMLEELVGSNHPWRVYPVKYVVNVAELRQRAAEKAAAEEAGKGSEEPAKEAANSVQAPPK